MFFRDWFVRYYGDGITATSRKNSVSYLFTPRSPFYVFNIMILWVHLSSKSIEKMTDLWSFALDISDQWSFALDISDQWSFALAISDLWSSTL